MGEKLFSLLGALVGVAMVAVIVQSPKTSSVIKYSGDAFAQSVRAAMGK